jgi:hypothetical protein
MILIFQNDKIWKDNLRHNDLKYLELNNVFIMEGELVLNWKDVGVNTLRKLRRNRRLEGILKDIVAIYVKRST